MGDKTLSQQSMQIMIQDAVMDIDPSSEIPMIVASCAIAGVLGAYLLLHPKANVNVLLWIIIFITVIRVPASIVLGFWIISQFFYFFIVYKFIG